jgi:hypothetical protein
MASRIGPALPLALVLGCLCGCATAAHVSAPVHAAAPDCSFRAATSCWTLAARFPPRRAQTADSQPGRILSLPPAVLASEADSARRAP